MDLGSMLTWYWLMAVTGTVFLGLRMAAMLVGAGDGGHGGDAAGHAGDGGGDAAHGGGHDHASDHADHGDSDHSLQVFTTQGLAAFLMGTGWLGVALHGRLPLLAGLAASAVFGAGLLVLMAWTLARIKRAGGSGTFHVASCVGQPAKVYLRIPAGGIGQVQLRAQGRFVTMPATCDAQALDTGRDVIVYDVRADRVLKVAPDELPRSG